MVRKVEHSNKDLKQKLERAKGGDLASAKQLDQAEASDPETTEAVEQEAADGPKGHGLAR